MLKCNQKLLVNQKKITGHGSFIIFDSELIVYSITNGKYVFFKISSFQVLNAKAFNDDDDYGGRYYYRKGEVQSKSLRNVPECKIIIL